MGPLEKKTPGLSGGVGGGKNPGGKKGSTGSKREGKGLSINGGGARPK